MLSQYFIKIMHFWGGISQTYYCIFLSVVNVTYDNLVKEYPFASFPLITNKFFGGENLRLHKYPLIIKLLILG